MNVRTELQYNKEKKIRKTKMLKNNGSILLLLLEVLVITTTTTTAVSEPWLTSYSSSRQQQQRQQRQQQRKLQQNAEELLETNNSNNKCFDDVEYDPFRLLTDINGLNTFDKFGLSIAFNFDGTTIAIGSSNGFTDVYRYRYSFTPSTFDEGNYGAFLSTIEQRDYLSPRIERRNENTNNSNNNVVKVAIDDTGTIVASSFVGSRFSSPVKLGYVRIDQRTTDDDGWEQLGKDIMNPNTIVGQEDEEGTNNNNNNNNNGDGEFGTVLALSYDGLTIAIGAPIDFDWKGSAFVYRYNIDLNDWILIGTFEGSDGYDGSDGDFVYDEYGSSIALSDNGNIVAIGAPTNGTGYIEVYQYNSNDNSWSLLGNVLIGDTETSYLGYSLSLSDVLVEENSGKRSLKLAAGSSLYEYIFERDVWMKMVDGVPGNGPISLSRDGTVLLMGNPNEDKGTFCCDEGVAELYVLQPQQEQETEGGSTTATTATTTTTTTTTPKSWNRIGRYSTRLFGTSERENAGDGIAMSSDGSILAIGSSRYPNGGTVGRIRFFTVDPRCLQQSPPLGTTIDSAVPETPTTSSPTPNPSMVMIPDVSDHPSASPTTTMDMVNVQPPASNTPLEQQQQQEEPSESPSSPNVMGDSPSSSIDDIPPTSNGSGGGDGGTTYKNCMYVILLSIACSCILCFLQVFLVS